MNDPETKFFEANGEDWVLKEPADGRASYVRHRAANGDATHIEMSVFLKTGNVKPQHLALRKLDHDRGVLRDASRS
jgi:hypothetical protein